MFSEDAAEALGKVKTVNGQRILSEYAKKRETENRKKGAKRKKGSDEEESDHSDIEEDGDNERSETLLWNLPLLL